MAGSIRRLKKTYTSINDGNLDPLTSQPLSPEKIHLRLDVGREIILGVLVLALTQRGKLGRIRGAGPDNFVVWTGNHGDGPYFDARHVLDIIERVVGGILVVQVNRGTLKQLIGKILARVDFTTVDLAVERRRILSGVSTWRHTSGKLPLTAPSSNSTMKRFGTTFLWVNAALAAAAKSNRLLHAIVGCQDNPRAGLAGSMEGAWVRAPRDAERALCSLSYRGPRLRNYRETSDVQKSDVSENGML